MAVPEGFALPPLPYLVPLLLAVIGVAGLLVRTRPDVTESTVLGLVPWMATGAALHTLYQLPVDLDGVSPLLGTPAVYLTSFVFAGGAWLVLEAVTEDEALPLAGVGTVGFVLVAAVVVTAVQSLSLFWPGIILVLSVLLTAIVITGFRWLRPELIAPDVRLAAVVVFAHALDGISTAVGYDFLEFHERTPLSRLVLEFSASLPTADLVGAGWLFVLVKIAVAAAVVALFADYVRERPAEGFLLLGFVAAVGLGPGIQNVLLFAAA